MKVTISSRLGHLPWHLVPEKRGQGAGQFQQVGQVDSGVDADFFAEIHQVFGADIS